VETRVRLHRTSPLHLQGIQDFFDAYPIRTRLYSIGLLCSPRLTMLWTYLFDHSNTLRLLHQHVLDSRVGRAAGRGLRRHCTARPAHPRLPGAARAASPAPPCPPRRS
jgi:hypothetical protein